MNKSNRRVILLRHAKSDWYSGAPTDFDRPLNKRGSKDAPRAGRWLNDNNLIPDVICCSPALRTRETLEGVLTELPVDRERIHYVDDLYHASLERLDTLIDEHLLGGRTVLIIGHNPGLEWYLSDRVPSIRYPEDGKLMPTATVAVLEMDESDMPSLSHLVRPRDM